MSCMLLKYSSARFLFSTFDQFEMNNCDLKLFIEREPSKDGELHNPSKFSLDNNFLKTNKIVNEMSGQDLQVLEKYGGDIGQFPHKFKHKIVSDIVFKYQWSNVNLFDLILLFYEMLSAKMTFIYLEPNTKQIGVARTSSSLLVKEKSLSGQESDQD
ncbi:hypothetical protein Cni_G24830 [Canna indica]|uniref:Uncharacterized protein n=1 Tax=Canna indica TaxID=4628 RepID=A0AAQ3QNK9_9LILI|nr:hypothetical protein Cni_G24830 [Canna indica]